MDDVLHHVLWISVLMDRLLTVQEATYVLGRKDPKGRFVKSLREKGILQGAYIGRKLMFRESEVKRYIEEQFRAQN